MHRVTQITCVCCSNNCVVSIDEDNHNAVSGNHCYQGERFALQELACPTRSVDAYVAVSGGERELCAVHTSRPIQKERMLDAVAALKALTVPAPVWVNDVILADVCGSGVDFIASESVMEQA